MVVVNSILNYCYSRVQKSDTFRLGHDEMEACSWRGDGEWSYMYTHNTTVTESGGGNENLWARGKTESIKTYKWQKMSTCHISFLSLPPFEWERTDQRSGEFLYDSFSWRVTETKATLELGQVHGGKGGKKQTENMVTKCSLRRSDPTLFTSALAAYNGSRSIYRQAFLIDELSNKLPAYTKPL